MMMMHNLSQMQLNLQGNGQGQQPDANLQQQAAEQLL
jgi:hypothetical protein